MDGEHDHDNLEDHATRYQARLAELRRTLTPATEVAAAARYLDRCDEVPRDWRDRVDPDTLQMMTNCVLEQVFADRASPGECGFIAGLGITGYDEYFAMGRDVESVTEFGFTGNVFAASDYLEAWQEEVSDGL